MRLFLLKATSALFIWLVLLEEQNEWSETRTQSRSINAAKTLLLASWLGVAKLPAVQLAGPGGGMS